MLVMRIIGSRFQPSARKVPPGSIHADGMRGFTRTQISGEQAISDDGRALRRHAFFVECEGSEARAVLLACVGDNVDKVAAITQSAEFVEGEERCSGKVRFHAQHAVKFNRVSHRFVNLQSELRAVQNNVEHSFRTLVGFEQARRLLRRRGGRFPITSTHRPVRILCSATVRQGIRIRAFLNFASCKGVSRIAGARGVFRLMNAGAFRRNKPLLLAAKIHIGFRQRDSRDRAEFGVDLQQQIDILFNRSSKRIDLDRAWSTRR